jgi:hypothetical protein
MERKFRYANEIKIIYFEAKREMVAQVKPF